VTPLRTAAALLALAAPADATLSLEDAFSAAETQASVMRAFPSAPQPQPKAPRRPTQAELDALRAEAKALLDCWYRKLDEPCFWSRVAASSPLRTDPARKGDAYAGAFSGKPDPAKLELGVDALDADAVKEALNADPKADGFALLPGLLFFVGGGFVDDSGQLARELAAARSEGRIPPTDDFVTVLYAVDGEGYNAEAMGLHFVLEGGRWKLHSFTAFD